MNSTKYFIPVMLRVRIFQLRSVYISVHGSVTVMLVYSIVRFALRILDAIQTGHEIGFILFLGGMTLIPLMSTFRVLLKDGCPSFR